jgi:putative ATP-dependent endonuclease of OLD family
MHLSHIHITGFRGISSLSVSFHKGINVLIGENTTCKTAVLDALRLCLGLALERRDIYVRPEDFFADADGNQATAIQFDLTYVDLSPKQQGMFVELLDILKDGSPALCLHVRFVREGDRIRRLVWGGANEGQDVPFPVLELLYFTYLGALRDAARDLSPSRANRLSQLFLKLVDDPQQREQYARMINEQVHSQATWQTLLSQAVDSIQTHLNEMVLQGDNSMVALEFVDATFREIVEGLRLYMTRHSSSERGRQRGTEELIEPKSRFSISQNSLGLNNLLYIATVLGDLVERTEREPHSYTALIIEVCWFSLKWREGALR